MSQLTSITEKRKELADELRAFVKSQLSIWKEIAKVALELNAKSPSQQTQKATSAWMWIFSVPDTHIVDKRFTTYWLNMLTGEIEISKDTKKAFGQTQEASDNYILAVDPSFFDAETILTDLKAQLEGNGKEEKKED